MANPNILISCVICGHGTDAQRINLHHQNGACFGMRGHEDVREYWLRKRRSSKYRKIPFHITGPEMVSLFEGAGITPADITNREADGYHLCRIDHDGPYVIGNVFFDTLSENSKEMQHRKHFTNHFA